MILLEALHVTLPDKQALMHDMPVRFLPSGLTLTCNQKFLRHRFLSRATLGAYYLMTIA